jgi:hypothetical protein
MADARGKLAVPLVNLINSQLLAPGFTARRLPADLLGRPVLPESGDPAAFEDEDRDLAHPLAHTLYRVVELGLPLGDHRVAI